VTPVRAGLVRTLAGTLAGTLAIVGCGGSSSPGADPLPATTAAPADPSTTGAPVPPTNSPPPASTTPASTTPASTTTASTTTASTTSAPAPVDEWGQPQPPASAAELAGRLTAVEAALRAAPPPGRDRVEVLGHEQQVLVRTYGRNPEWSTELTGLLDPSVLARLDALAAAGAAGAETLPDPLTSVPAWRIRSPLDPGALTQLYRNAEADTGTPWEVLAAVNLVETRMGRIVGLSSVGAQGPMQFIPSTWDVYGEGGDPFGDADAIAAAGRFLAAKGAPGDLEAAVFAYNPSDAYVASVLGYAAALEADPWLYLGLWGWQVYLLTEPGVQWLPDGFESPEPTPLSDVADELPPPVPTP
jgi:hypothetical protein